MSDIDKTIEIFDKERFTLNQYLKDNEMKIHEKRFFKMLAAMETATRYLKEYKMINYKLSSISHVLSMKEPEEPCVESQNEQAR